MSYNINSNLALYDKSKNCNMQFPKGSYKREKYVKYVKMGDVVTDIDLFFH